MLVAVSAVRQQSLGCCAWLCCPFYSVQSTSPWVGATHIQSDKAILSSVWGAIEISVSSAAATTPILF